MYPIFFLFAKLEKRPNTAGFIGFCFSSVLDLCPGKLLYILLTDIFFLSHFVPHRVSSTTPRLVSIFLFRNSDGDESDVHNHPKTAEDQAADNDDTDNVDVDPRTLATANCFPAKQHPSIATSLPFGLWRERQCFSKPPLNRIEQISRHLHRRFTSTVVPVEQTPLNYGLHGSLFQVHLEDLEFYLPQI